MLKIKDNIKLSILKQYGFKRNGKKYVLSTFIENYGYFYYPEETSFEMIVENDRILTFHCGIEFNPNEYKCLNSEKWADSYVLSWYISILYDQIKDGLVEKTSDEE